MVRDYDLYSLGRDPISLLKNITTLSLVKSLVEYGQSFATENTYEERNFNRFVNVSPLKKP